jgi:hypothetical protein
MVAGVYEPGEVAATGAFIFIDAWHERWLKVEESGLEWIGSPPRKWIP